MGRKTTGVLRVVLRGRIDGGVVMIQKADAI